MSAKPKMLVFGVKYFPSQGGTSRVAETIIRELRTKYDITIYCFNNKKAEKNLDKVTVIQFPKLPLASIGVFFYFFISAIYFLFSKKYDLVHVHKTDAAFFIPLLKLKSKVIATSHEAPYNRDKWNFFGKFYFRIMEKIFVRSGAMLTCVSKPLTELYNKRYGTNVFYVPNGVDLNNERDHQGANEILNSFDIKGDFILFAARRLMSTKGCHTFLAAMKQVNYKGTIVIAGESSHSAAYMKNLEALSKGLNVKFVGFVNGIAKLMALIERAKLFVFPSEIEGLSIMLLEVGSTGKTPLICSDIPENTEVFTEEHVLYFRNKDASNLAEAFLWSEANPEIMAQKAILARKHVIEEFSSAALASKYDVLYQQLLNHKA